MSWYVQEKQKHLYLPDDVKITQQREILHYLLLNSRTNQRTFYFGQQAAIFFRLMIGFAAADAWIPTDLTSRLLVDEQSLPKAACYFTLLFNTQMVQDVVGVVIQYLPDFIPKQATMCYRERHAYLCSGKRWNEWVFS
jgi:hypothetical protein